MVPDNAIGFCVGVPLVDFYYLSLGVLNGHAVIGRSLVDPVDVGTFAGGDIRSEIPRGREIQFRRGVLRIGSTGY